MENLFSGDTSSFLEVPEHCFEVFRKCHPAFSDWSNVEIEAHVLYSVNEVVDTFYAIIDHFMYTVLSSAIISDDKKRQLRDGAFNELHSKSALFINKEKTYEAICKTNDEVTTFLNNEGQLFVSIFKELVTKSIRTLYYVFAGKYSKYSSLESLLFCHRSINEMLLEAKGSIGTREPFHDQIMNVVVTQCENLIYFFEKEMDRIQREQYIINRTVVGNASKLQSENDIHASLIKHPSHIRKVKHLSVTFEDLFVLTYKPYINDFIDILRHVTPELINADGDWIGVKNAARIYVNALKYNGIIKPKTTQREAHAALSSKFSDLGDSFMRKPEKSTKADDTYSDMTERICILKSMIKTKLH